MEWTEDRLLLWIAAAVCTVFLLIRWSKGRRIQRIVGEGNFVWAEITGCDSSWKANNQTYCCFRAKYREEDGREHEFLSDAVRTVMVHDKIGSRVKVYLSEGSFEDYYVDPDSICQAE